MANKSDDLSLEVLQKVDQFYNQSFVKLSEFYEQSFNTLLIYIGWIGAIVFAFAGFIAPFIVWYFQKKRSQKLRAETKEKIESLNQQYEERIKSELEKFRAEFKKMEIDLKQEIYITEFKGLIFQAAATKHFSVKIVLLQIVINCCLDRCLDVKNFYLSFRLLKEALQELIETPSQELQDLNLEEGFKNLITKLKSHKKEDFLFQTMVTELEVEFKKALEHINKT